MAGQGLRCRQQRVWHGSGGTAWGSRSRQQTRRWATQWTAPPTTTLQLTPQQPPPQRSTTNESSSRCQSMWWMWIESLYAMFREEGQGKKDFPREHINGIAKVIGIYWKERSLSKRNHCEVVYIPSSIYKLKSSLLRPFAFLSWVHFLLLLTL